MYKTLLVGNQPVIIKAFLDILNARVPGCQVDVAASMAGIEASVSKGNYQFLILCIESSVLGLEQVCHIMQHNPKTAVVLFTDHFSKLPAKLLYQKGIRGIVKKSAETDEIVAAIQHVYNGQTFVETGLMIKMCSHPEPSLKGTRLTAKQTVVTKLLIGGRTNLQICEDLHLAPSTVSAFKTRVLKKMGVRNVIELKHEFDRSRASL